MCRRRRAGTRVSIDQERGIVSHILFTASRDPYERRKASRVNFGGSPAPLFGGARSRFISVREHELSIRILEIVRRGTSKFRERYGGRGREGGRGKIRFVKNNETRQTLELVFLLLRSNGERERGKERSDRKIARRERRRIHICISATKIRGNDSRGHRQEHDGT